MIIVSTKQMERAELLLKGIPKGAEKAVSAALNRAAEGGRSVAVKKVRERYFIKAVYVRKEIKIKKANVNDLMAEIRASGSPLALTKFKVTPSAPSPQKRKRPIKVRVTKDGGGTIKNAFVAKMQSGHIGVFRRVSKKRLPISELYGPSVPQMLGHKTVSENIEEIVKDRFEKRLEHEIERLLMKVGNK